MLAFNTPDLYYTYYSYESDGRGYIGYRKCPTDKTPETDSYMGSYTDETFKPTHKNILGIFSNPNDAINHEMVLHEVFQVDINPHFANRAKQTSTHFRVSKHDIATINKMKKPKSEEHKKNIAKSKVGAKNPMYNKVGANRGISFDKNWKDKLKLAKNPRKYIWLNFYTLSLEKHKSISYMSNKHAVSETELRRLVSGEKDILKKSGWQCITTTNSQDQTLSVECKV